MPLRRFGYNIAAMICHEHRFIFVHIPKTAGTSVARAIEKVGGAHYPWRPFHKTCAELAGIEIPWATWNAYFKFAFVRNPWDLHLSKYLFVREKRGHPLHEAVSSMSFRDFTFWLRDNMAGLNAGDSFRNLRQVDFVTGADGRLMVDFVGRFERLRDDWNTICKQTGVRAKLPHANRTEHGSYPDYYDDETRGIVGALYAADVERFGYAFGA
ncbi:MAG: sulfotransferase family protein [Lentisphaerae bacterium]|nr:sulfotransferase family protein [Lentisphaerota bacterium]